MTIKTLMYDNKNLNLPGLEWIGLKLSDIDNFLPQQNAEFLFKLNEPDKRIAKSLIAKFDALKEYDLINEVDFFLNQ